MNKILAILNITAETKQYHHFLNNYTFCYLISGMVLYCNLTSRMLQTVNEFLKCFSI